MAEERTTAAGERTRERILEVSLPLFAERGFAGTSVRRVAAAAEVNVATLAYHFTDKAGLYDAVIERLYAEVGQVPVTLVRRDGDDGLTTVVRTAWAFCQQHRVSLTLLHRHLLDAGRHHDASNTWLEPLLARVRPLVQAVVPDVSEARFRLTVFSAMHLLIRFALEDRDQLATMLAIEGDLDDALVMWVRDMVATRAT